MAHKASKTTSSRKRASTRKRPPASAFDVLRSMAADFGDPAVKTVFHDAAKALEKAKKVARALVFDLKAKASEKPDVVYHNPALAMKHAAFYFGDMQDAALLPFLNQDKKAAAHVFSFEPLAGIKATEAADIFLYDEEEVLVPLTALALALEEQSKHGKTDAVAAHLSYFLVRLVKHLELGINVHGYVDLPREPKAKK
jgi:hypothetical protein